MILLAQRRLEVRGSQTIPVFMRATTPPHCDDGIRLRYSHQMAEAADWVSFYVVAGGAAAAP
jgi:hypothetical protein